MCSIQRLQIDRSIETSTSVMSTNPIRKPDLQMSIWHWKQRPSASASISIDFATCIWSTLSCRIRDILPELAEILFVDSWDFAHRNYLLLRCSHVKHRAHWGLRILMRSFAQHLLPMIEQMKSRMGRSSSRFLLHSPQPFLLWNILKVDLFMEPPKHCAPRWGTVVVQDVMHEKIITGTA
jgi:hypothetical protein